MRFGKEGWGGGAIQYGQHGRCERREDTTVGDRNIASDGETYE